VQAVLRECCISEFHHGFAFSEGRAIFAVLWVALSRASCIAITASLVCDCVMFMSVRFVKTFQCLSIALENASVHFLTSVSLRLKHGLLDGVFIDHWPWSIVHVMGKWSDVKDNLWFTCQFLMVELFEVDVLTNIKSMIDCWPDFDCQVGMPGVLMRVRLLLSNQFLC
jgi:hypothetical protein